MESFMRLFCHWQIHRSTILHLVVLPVSNRSFFVDFCFHFVLSLDFKYQKTVGEAEGEADSSIYRLTIAF